MTQLIKPTRRIGNASGVVLPKEWENSLVRIELIKSPLDDIDLLKVLKQEIELKDIVGVYLIGSFARGDYSDLSDRDILVVSTSIDKEIKKGDYEITIIPEYILDEQKGYPLYYSMLKEAKPIINKSLLDDYLASLELSIRGVKEYLGAATKMIKESRKAVDEARFIGSDVTYDAVAYSLVLRLRGLYILDCAVEDKIVFKKELLSLIRRLTGSLNIYERYLAIKKGDEPCFDSVSVDDAEKIIEYLKEGIKKWGKIVRGKERF